MDHPSIEVSIVVPFYNEEENITPLYEKLTKVLGQVGRRYELVFVDDGSTDKTHDLLKKLAQKDSLIRLITLRTNFGQSAALAAGFDHTRGEIIIAMDGDLQHDPEEIPLFLGKIEEGYDIVSGWRKERIDPFLNRKLPSLIANKLIAKISKVPLHDFGTTFKAYRRNILKQLELFGNFHRFIPALAKEIGARIVEIPIKNIQRNSGNSKYGISRTYGVFMDLIILKYLISYKKAPLRFFGLIGTLFFFMGFCICSFLILLTLVYGIPLREYNMLVLFSILMILIGVHVIFLGIVAELLSRIYYKIGPTPLYAVKEESSTHR